MALDPLDIPRGAARGGEGATDKFVPTVPLRIRKWVTRKRVIPTQASADREMETYQTGSIDPDLLRRFQRQLDLVLDKCVSQPFEPTPWIEAVSEKNLSKTVGAPLQFACGTYRGFLASLVDVDPSQLNDELAEKAKAKVVDMCEEAESDLLSGEVFRSVYTVAPKTDAYSEKKVINRRYRSLCGEALFTTLFLCRWLGTIDSCVKSTCESILSILTTEQVIDKLLSMKMFGVGLDMTACDKTLPQEMVASVVRGLCARVNMPPQIVNFLVAQCAFASCVSANQLIFFLGGGNPSGNRLTSTINSLVHVCLARMCFKLHDHDMSAHVVVNSDDSVYFFTKAGEATKFIEWYVPFCREEFGIEFKVEMLDGSPFPPGTHPPFCGTVYTHVSEFYCPVPVDLGRRFVSCVHHSTLDDDSTRRAIVEALYGTSVNLAPYVYACYYMRVPVPEVIRAFIADCSDYGIDALKVAAFYGPHDFVHRKTLRRLGPVGKSE